MLQPVDKCRRREDVDDLCATVSRDPEQMMGIQTAATIIIQLSGSFMRPIDLWAMNRRITERITRKIQMIEPARY